MNEPIIKKYIYDNHIHSVKIWYQDGCIHRDDGPAQITENKYFNSTEKILLYMKNNLIHRDDGPAYIRMINSKVVEQIWYQHNYKHREMNPAYISKYVSRYYIYGKQVCKTDMINQYNNIINNIFRKSKLYDKNINSLIFEYL